MFLRIEGFQVEIKEINKTWERPASIKNFNIGESLLVGWLVTLPGGTAGYYLNRMMFSEKSTSEVEKFQALSLCRGPYLHPPASPYYHNRAEF